MSEIFYENDKVKLINGDMLSALDEIDGNSIDCIITDPPYELNFMGKGWDNTGIVFQPTTWEKCLRVLKPGGYLLCFGASRNFYRVFCAIEDAGFEIRDTIMWLYGSGFPKGQDLGKSIEAKLTLGSANTKDFKYLDGDKIITRATGYNKMQFEQGDRPKHYTGKESVTNVKLSNPIALEFDGWNSALKPAYEPIIMARKPCESSLTDNVIKYGVGGFNIDECRVGTEIIKSQSMPDLQDVGHKQSANGDRNGFSFGMVENAERINVETETVGRYPANLILSYGEEDKEEVCNGFPNDDSGSASRYFENCNYAETDEEDVKRYFYCPKASRQDRDEGIENKNYHPTVKPTKLMRYLVRLVAPKGATILDPFNGSGSTGKAVMLESREFDKDYKYIGIDLSKEYLEISKARIEYARTGELVTYYDGQSKENLKKVDTEQSNKSNIKTYKKTSLW